MDSSHSNRTVSILYVIKFNIKPQACFDKKHTLIDRQRDSRMQNGSVIPLNGVNAKNGSYCL